MAAERGVSAALRTPGVLARQRRGIAGILQLPQHLGVRQHLS